MKKLLLLIVLSFSLVMCNVAKDDTGEKTTEEKLPEKLVVGLDDTFAPMGFKDEKGEIVGFDIDLAKAVAEKLGVDVEFKSINWDAKIMDLNNKNIDFIWNGLTMTEERKQEVLFSEPYLENTQIILVREGSDIKNKSNLENKNVGTQTQSSGEMAFNKDEISKKTNLKTYDQYSQAFEDLDAGRIDALVIDEVMAKYIKKIKEDKAGKALYSILEDNLGTETYGIGGRKTDTELMNKVNIAIEELKKDGTYDKIKQKWFGE